MARIGIGDLAPMFSLESVNMGTVSLKNFEDRRVVIIFGRYFGCPVCQLDFDELLNHREMIREYAELVYFTQSSPESARDYISEYEVDFPVISVTKEDDYQTYKDYDVGNMGPSTLFNIFKKAREAKKAGKIHGAYEGRETQSPADFVVDETGRIIWVNRGMLNLEKLLIFLEGF